MTGGQINNAEAKANKHTERIYFEVFSQDNTLPQAVETTIAKYTSFKRTHA